MTTIRTSFRIADSLTLLKSVHLALGDPSPLAADALLVMQRRTQLTFEQQGFPQRWADLAPSTKRRRLARLSPGVSAKKLAQLAGSLLILRDTGQLLQSVGGDASGDFEASGGFGFSDRDGAIIGTDHPGGYNQFEDPRTGRPERIIFQWLDQDVDDITAMSHDWFLRKGPYAEG
jgi:hypothetical protein